MAWITSPSISRIRATRRQKHILEEEPVLRPQGAGFSQHKDRLCSTICWRAKLSLLPLAEGGCVWTLDQKVALSFPSTVTQHVHDKVISRLLSLQPGLHPDVNWPGTACIQIYSPYCVHSALLVPLSEIQL